MPLTLARRATIEGIGTAFLLATIVGSGIMGDRLSGGNPWQALLANSLATGAVLVALIASFAPLSGAHFNPVVTLVEAIAIDVQSSEVTLTDGTRVGYDRLIVAPGIMRSPATANLPRAIPLASSPGR